MTLSGKALLVDTSKCVGCRACQVACKQWNELAADSRHSMLAGTFQNAEEFSASTWTIVRFAERRTPSGVAWLFAKTQCMHCTDAACVAVCPTGALSKQGQVTYLDETKCIGERYCVQACPYQAIHLDERKGIVQKCTLCVDRLAHDVTPACVKACPAAALTWGDRAAQVAAAERRVSVLRAGGYPNAQTYGVNELGGLGYVYVLLDEPATYQLPNVPVSKPLDVGHQLTDWASGIVAMGLGALPIWWVFRRRNEIARAEEEVRR